MIGTLNADAPAIAGGEPAKRTPYGREKRYGQEELRELEEALDQGTLFYAQGKKVRKLEEAFASQNGVRFAIACSSGTAAIHSALIAIGLSPGDEVITSPITDIGTVVPILYQGGVPVFADLEPDSHTLSPESVRVAITPRTRAVLAVHLWGNACNLTALREICDERGLILIEDCAQALGSVYNGRPIGTIAPIGCFSLNEYKHIACGDGGIVLTDDAETAARLRLATDKCYNRQADAVSRMPVFLANNYRMTELQAAVAVAQLPKLESIVARRRAWCGALSERLQTVPGISLPRPTDGCNPSWLFYMLRVVPEELNADADQFAEALRAEGLPAGAHYIGRCLYEYPIFAQRSAFACGEHPFAQGRYEQGLCPEAEAILQTCVMLTINEAYTQADLDETAQAINRAARWFARGGRSDG